MPLKRKPAALATRPAEDDEGLSAGQHDDLRNSPSTFKTQAVRELTTYTVDRWLHVEVRA